MNFVLTKNLNCDEWDEKKKIKSNWILMFWTYILKCRRYPYFLIYALQFHYPARTWILDLLKIYDLIKNNIKIKIGLLFTVLVLSTWLKVGLGNFVFPPSSINWAWSVWIKILINVFIQLTNILLNNILNLKCLFWVYCFKSPNVGCFFYH